MKAISFLGTNNYTETTYVYVNGAQEITCTTPYFAEALATFFPELDQIYVLVTPAVQVHSNLAALKSRLGERCQVVPIPSGHSEPELWKIFDALIAVVEEGDHVIFDITNSFRSLPFLTFLAAAYLRTAQQVKVEKITYGAFEARDLDANRTPVFDLTPFITLLDWLTATNQFIYTGDGRYLARLITAADTFEHPRRRLTPEEREAELVSKRIRGAAHAIEETSLALLTSLIPHAEQASYKLVERLQDAAEALAAQAPPYRMLAERIRATYAPFSAAAPMQDDLLADLKLQRAMVRWYLDKGHLPQAFTLMREWVVSAVGYRLGIRDQRILAHGDERYKIEEALGWAKQGLIEPQLLEVPPSEWAERLGALPGFKDLATFWNRLVDLRNLINHGAMRAAWEQTPVKTVVDNSETLYTQFEALVPVLLEDPTCLS